MTAQLQGGATSREALAARLVGAIARRDTAEVRAMVMTRREFAYLYYPTSPFTRPPYRQMPQLVWLFIAENSGKGITRAFERLGGRELRYRGLVCERTAAREGRNALWSACLVRLAVGRDTSSVRLFGSILERDRRFKFVSYANDF